MIMLPFPFEVTDWEKIEPVEYEGETGKAVWKTQLFGPEDNRIRVRVIEYYQNYLADHWCEEGHILFCLEGSIECRLKDGRKFTLTQGMSYQVGDASEPHQSFSLNGAKLLIVD